jgi:outer membrane protein TolC
LSGNVCEGGRDVTMRLHRVRLWKRWIAGGLLALLPATGCKHQTFLEPSDHKTALMAGLERLETHPHSSIPPSIISPGAAPATATDPTRPPRNISLKECIAIAVEKGNLGSIGGSFNAGNVNDSLVQFNGRQTGGSDSLKALVIDPAVVGADIERSLSKFDARWISSLTWSKNDQPVVNFQQQITNGDAATISTTLAKPLPTGGVAGITFSTDYRKFAVTSSAFASQVNPAYTPRLQFLFEQPLLQGFGIEINQLAQNHPGSLLIPGLRPSGGQTTEGILITRIRYDQQRAEFDRQINQLLINVETAYWNLYAAYYNLYAQEETLKQAFSLYTNIKKRHDAGAVRLGELTQTESQYWTFERNILEARNQVLDAERALRGLLGENSFSDGLRLVPTDEPTLAPYKPDYFEQVNEALGSRPELIIARHDLKAQQLNLILAKNQRRPDLRFFASQDVAGIGTRLDGSPIIRDASGNTVQQNAFASLADNNANSWQLGIRLDIPLGFRDANAAVRQAQLQMVKSHYQLQDSERKTMEVVLRQWRNIEFRHRDIELRRQTRLKLQQTLALSQKFIDEGAFDVNTLFNILQVQQNFAASLAGEYRAIADYNAALAALEFEKGTIQRYNNVTVGEGPLPPHVQKKASDHFSARNAAIKLRERSTENPLPPLAAPVPEVAPVAPAVPMPPAAPPGTALAPTFQDIRPVVSPWPGTQESPGAVFSPIGTAHIPTRKLIQPPTATEPISTQPK